MSPRPDLVRGLVTDAPIVGPLWRPTITFLIPAEGHVRPAIVAVQNTYLLPPLLHLHRLLCNDEDHLASINFHPYTRFPIDSSPIYSRARDYFADVVTALASGAEFPLDRNPVDGKLTIAAQVQSAFLRQASQDVELDLFRRYLDEKAFTSAMRRQMLVRCRSDHVTKAGWEVHRALEKLLHDEAARTGKLRARPPRRRPSPDVAAKNVTVGPWRR